MNPTKSKKTLKRPRFRREPAISPAPRAYTKGIDSAKCLASFVLTFVFFKLQELVLHNQYTRFVIGRPCHPSLNALQHAAPEILKHYPPRLYPYIHAGAVKTSDSPFGRTTPPDPGPSSVGSGCSPFLNTSNPACPCDTFNCSSNQTSTPIGITTIPCQATHDFSHGSGSSKEAANGPTVVQSHSR